MRKEIIIYALLASTTILSSCINGKSEGQGKPAIDSISDTLAGKGIAVPEAEKLSKEEQTFVFAAATGSSMEIEAGNLAAVQSKNREIQSFGTKMMTDHRKAAEELSTVAKKLGIQVPDSLTKDQSMHLNRLAILNDLAFDQQYITMMMADHAKTIKLFQEAANLSDADLKAFAAKMIPVIDAHYKMAVAIGKKLNLKNANNGDDLDGESPAPGHTN